MKDIKALMRIECLARGKWEPVQDIRQLEPGDIVRMVKEDGTLIPCAGGTSTQAIASASQLKMRMLTPVEYERVLNAVAVPAAPAINPVTLP
jgi:hypothetical protein